jgi:hypothetical protein
MNKAAISVFSAMAVCLSGSVAVPIEATGAGVVADAPAAAGQWSSPFTPAGGNPRVIGVHAVMLHTGKVLMFGNLRPTQGYVFDPVTRTATETDPPVDIECGGVTPLEDGRILVVGGHASGNTGIDNILLFDPATATWTAQPPSPKGRYYPTTTRLADGRVLISGGFTSSGAKNPDVEVYTPPPAGSSRGTLALVGQHVGGLYPNQWLLPNGKVLEIKGRATSLLDPATWTWTPLARTKFNHGSGNSAVLLPGTPSGSTKVILAGGGSSTSSVAAAESFDAANPAAGWTALAPMPTPRAHMSPVLLPDGTVLGVGGNSVGLFDQPQFAALRYSPSTNSWTTLAAQAKRRAYHSSAVLLPDGRVLSGGDTGTGGGGNTNEIYSPPYLFQGSRPTISSAPTQVAHGATFTVITPNPASRAVLMDSGAATHTRDMSERYVALKVTAGSGSLTAVVPSGTVAPTGWYMLFLVNGAGIPSTATWIHVG